MNKTNDDEMIDKLQQEQMLKMITKSFYNEMINYGINKNDIVTISTHLLDHLLESDEDRSRSIEYYNRDFKLNSVWDEWKNKKRLTVGNVSISPLQPGQYSKVGMWLANPEIKYNFTSMFPDSDAALTLYFEQPIRNYFGIFDGGEFVGIVGADNIDNTSLKVEMRKFIGNSSLQGKGLGKRATFLFLYYSFVILKYNKVYIYSGNTNMRNINLNSKFGFELEGIFFKDVFLRDKMQDVVRMGLLKSRWMRIFSNV